MRVPIRKTTWLLAVLVLNFEHPVIIAMDGQTAGLGLLDLDIYDEENLLYTDRSIKPQQVSGMPHEFKVLMKSVDEFQRRNPVNRKAQEEADEREAEREDELPEQKIPRKIWQRCYSKPLPLVEEAYSKTWIDMNPEYLHTLADDDEARGFVEEFYPALENVYSKLHARQASEEFWAYLIIYKYGGIYASLDCTCERPMRKFLEAEDNFIVGIQPRISSPVLQKQMGLKHHTFPFQQWCFAAAPGHPVLHFMIDYIVKNIDRAFCAENDNIDATLRTGAAPFTDAVFAFRRRPVPPHTLRLAPVGAFGLGAAWGDGDRIESPCAHRRHGYGYWFDERGRKHHCDCPTRREEAQRRRGQNESPCFVRRRHIQGPGVRLIHLTIVVPGGDRALVRFPELNRLRSKRRVKS